MEKMISHYQEYAKKLMDKTERENLSKDDVNKMVVLLHNVNKDGKLDESLMLIYNILLCLRNSCIHCMKNQNIIINSNIFEAYKDLMDEILSPELRQDPSLVAKVRKISVQFLGNLVVKNPDSQKAVWKAAFPNLFFNLMSNLEAKEKDFLCMVAYNCLKNRIELYATKDEYWFLVTVIEHCKDYQDAHWGLLIMELIITSTSFVDFFKELNDYSGLRCSIIDFIIANLSSGGIEIPEKSILYFCNVFTTKSTCILMLASSLSTELEDEVHLLLKTLSLMCIVTSMVHKYDQIRKNEKLLESVIGLLNQKQLAKQEKKIKENLPDQHPEVGFERDLVRVLGNMIYENKLIQDKVRELKGIEILLNACNIDSSNPYIMQWAVFAIKNLCKDNINNQKYIKRLDAQGLASNEILAQNSLEARLVDGKIKIANQKQ